MNNDRHARERRYGMFALAIATFLLGITFLAINIDSLTNVAFAGVMMIVSAYFVKASRTVVVNRGVEDHARGPNALLWVCCVAASAALAISFFFLYRDAIHGYHEIWPVFAFAASGVVALVVWAFVVAKLWHLL